MGREFRPRRRLTDPDSTAAASNPSGSPMTVSAEGRSIDYAAILAVAGLAYFVMIGDAASRATHPVGLVLNAVIAAMVVLLYAIRAARGADRLDRAVLLAVIMFAGGAILSSVTRQSFDSILGMLMFAAGLFLLRDVMARAAGRRFLILAFMALSAIVTLLTAQRWLADFINWWSLTEWTVFPPLGMNLAAEPWGHRHDLALLMAMLYPAWWVGSPKALRRVLAIVIGVLDLLLIFVGGSRMVWLAIIVAGLVVGLPLVGGRFGIRRRTLAVLATVATIGLAAVVFTGIAGPIAERILGGASLTERSAMWGPLVDVWGDKPLFGNGLGSFPWTLQLTDYFDTHSFSPRHPDSAVVQLAAEAGLVGLAAMLIVTVAAARELFGGRSAAATFALVAFGIAALGGNPTDFDFMVATAIAWLAFAAPHVPATGTAEAHTWWPRPITAVSLVLLAVIGVAFAATIGASVAYAIARDEIGAGRLDGAIAPMGVAHALDPGLAIYSRQLGTLYLLTDRLSEAIEALEEAVTDNPQDDVAWRALAIARGEAGDDAGATMAIDRAVETQRSDPSNLLLALRERSEEGDDVTALAAEIVQAWPLVVVTPGWQSLIGEAGTDVVDAAYQRWADGTDSPEPLFSQPLILRALEGRDDPHVGLRESRFGIGLQDAYMAVMTCDPSARQKLSSASDEDRRQATYWALIVRQARLDGKDAGGPARIYTIMTGDPVFEGVTWRLNPLDENGVRGSSADRWGYRRPSIDWPAARWDLPPPRSGVTMWHLEPRESAATAGLTDQLPGCT
jgi:O-antigen ligase